jgi:tetratricopeptide (TPR) repeat protein
MHPSVLTVLVGLLYILSFGALSFMRRQGLSVRFAVEGVVITALFALLPLAGVTVHVLLFVIVLYLVTMRARLLVDLGNAFAARGRYERALALYRLALRLGPDVASRRIVLINRGVAELRRQEPETAYNTLEEALSGDSLRLGAKDQAAGCYNLGLACRRTGREAEAVRRFNQAIDAFPHSIYAEAARQALKKSQVRPEHGDAPLR